MVQKTVITLVISFFVLSCESADPYQGHYIDLSFNEKVTFGQPDSLSESTLHHARDARVGPDGKIYAADAGMAKIKVYDPTGQLINSFGKRGRGPGELTDIRGFTVTDSTVLVWDQSVQRMTVFGLDGKFRTVHNLKGSPFPMRIYPLKNSYLALHGDEHYGDQLKQTRLGHTYSVDFSKQKENFLTLKNINNKLGKLSQVLRAWTGHILVQNNQQFLFIPLLYNGNIYEYSKKSKGWRQTHRFKGLNQQDPYSFIADGDKRRPDGKVSSLHLAEEKQYVAHNLSRGLLGYNGYIFHFTFSDINDKRVFGVEVYDEDMEPVGYSPIESIPITSKEDNFLSWFVEDVDEKGNFYFLQRNDEGTKIRVMQIDQQDLENL